MKTLLSHLRPALMATLVLAAVTCGAYPLLITAIAKNAFREKAEGSLIKDANGTVRGSALLAQPFSDPKYFHPRPSAAGTGHDAASSGGSNLGPTSQKLHDTIKARITAYRALNSLDPATEVPADAVTASASGLDPHITIKNAELQTARVAKARNVSEHKIRDLIKSNTDQPGLGILGDPGVNVLKLNLALDRAP